MARLQKKKQAAVTTGSAASSGIPRAMALRLIRGLPGAPGFLATIGRSIRLSDLDTSIGVPGHHDFAVRTGSFVRVIRSRCNPTRPPHPALHVHDDREAPLS
ncbi:MULTISPECIES: hypothetical protein [unclassified Bradyrhizobium]|uniref:hypothetical protein n=1 Tax=unclassified Bradyrhizobium TaxID=2631580 RepID=UPI002915F209|nr:MULTISPECIES: hypothetical protein [unclassified Bradyrhizobium]